MRWNIWIFIKKTLLTLYIYMYTMWIILFNKFWSALKSIFNVFYKKFIDFLFFDLYRNRVLIKLKIKFLIKLSMRVLFTFTFFYQNVCGLIFNFIFLEILDSFIVWDISNIYGILNICLSLLHLDNLILFIYIMFIKVGVSAVYHNNPIDTYITMWSYWQYFLIEYRTDNVNFSFFKFFFDNMLVSFNNIEFNLNFFDCCPNTPAFTPAFFYFGTLFFSTVIFSWFFFSYIGLYGIYKLNLITLFLFWLSLLLSAKSIFLNQSSFIIKLCSWVFLTINIKIDYYFLIDTISFSFMLLTTTIALFVYIYAFSYFRYEPLVDRFLLFILSFVISMIFLVTSGNTIMLFLGWELIGFTSFCLINFWTTKTATLKSAFKAFTFNKVSDFFMFIFLVSTFSIYYTFDILALNHQVFRYESLSIYIFGTPINYLEFVALMVLGAAFIKSAQLGGHAWLPDSMEAPVPASSLIHSATLVSAGVYLILRFNFIFDVTQYTKLIIPLVGSLTAAYGGVCALAQSDIKKTLAYSTISHCGFLMVLCSTEMNEFTILYLYVHGFFKAGVFMCVGNVLRITRGYQDTRRMGGLLKYLPFEYFCITVGLLNLAGLPFTFGFFIKHLLLVSLDTHTHIYTFVMFNCLIGAFSGLFYSFKIINYTFGDFKKSNKVIYLNTNNTNYNSNFYTNSSIASTISIFCLFMVSYIITYYLFKYFMSGNYLFSDYVNTTILTNYYSIINSFSGYLLNFSYINITVVIIILVLFFSKGRKTYKNNNTFSIFSKVLVLFIFIFIFYKII